jgi:hypothetical protein
MPLTGSTPSLAEAARVMREAVRDKSYQVTPLGEEIANYLHVKRKRLTAASFQDYESVLDKLARYFPDLRLEDFEPPSGTEHLEAFLALIHRFVAGDCPVGRVK